MKGRCDPTRTRELRRVRPAPLLDVTRLRQTGGLTRPHSTGLDSHSRVRSHRARTAVADAETEWRKVPANERFLEMERTGIEPVTSGLQTHPIARPHLTPTDRIGMTEPYSAICRTSPDTVRRRSARTALARPLPKWATMVRSTESRRSSCRGLARPFLWALPYLRLGLTWPGNSSALRAPHRSPHPFPRLARRSS
jgi:hypothetical protein